MEKSKRVGFYSAKIMISLAVMLMLRTLWAIGQSGAAYHPYTVASVMVELFCLVMCASVYSAVGRAYSKRLFQKLFLWMLALTAIGMLGDICTWGIGLENFFWYGAAHAVGSFLRDAMGFPLLVVYSIYLLSYVKNDAEELVGYGWLVSGLCVDGFFLVVINQITSRSTTQYWYLWELPWLFFSFWPCPWR